MKVMDDCFVLVLCCDYLFLLPTHYLFLLPSNTPSETQRKILLKMVMETRGHSSPMFSDKILALYKQNARIVHCCLTPLLFLPRYARWSPYPNIVNNDNDNDADNDGDICLQVAMAGGSHS